jgi:hypothetical protein
MSYLLFYSNYCPQGYSQKFIQILEQSGEASFFSKIPVDKNINGERPKIIYQYNITDVPTIIVNNTKLVGIDAFKWLDKKLEGVNTMHTRNNKNNLNDIKLHNDPKSDNTIMPFSPVNSKSFINITDINTAIYTSNDDSVDRNDNKFILQDDNITSTAINTPQRNNDNVRMPSINVKKDSLKQKQLTNEFNKILEERNLKN